MLARLVSRNLHEAGLLAKFVEYPAVGKDAARFRMQVMAKHSLDNIAEAVAIMSRCRNAGLREIEEMQRPSLQNVA